MSKRKNTDFTNNYEPILTNVYKLYEKYNNSLNCDKIIITNNHILFDALINKETISVLITFINNIINNKHLFDDFKIYLHINCKGGIFVELMNFMKFKNECIYEIISIIDNECYDSGFILASLCSYRIIKKNAKVFITNFSLAKNGDCYWNYFKQCESSETNGFKMLLYDVLCNNITSNLTFEKVNCYFQNTNITSWNSKKYKKLGLVDEIV